jgi:hypothetical protein
MADTARHSIETVAREVATIAHARALHAVYPIMRLGTPRLRDICYRHMGWEFRDLEASVEDLLRRSEVAAAGRQSARPSAATP